MVSMHLRNCNQLYLSTGIVSSLVVSSKASGQPSCKYALTIIVKHTLTNLTSVLGENCLHEKQFTLNSGKRYVLPMETSKSKMTSQILDSRGGGVTNAGFR